MSRHRLLAALVSTTLLLGAFAVAPIAPNPYAALAADEEPLPASATGRVRVVFADAASAGIATSKARANQRRVRVFEKDPGESVRASVRRWKKVPGVLDAQPEIRFHINDIADPYWDHQWDMMASELGSSRAESAWAKTTGDPSVVVSVLDTGRTDHPDLKAAMPTGWGADMVSDSHYSGDDDGRDSDPTDVGDWCGAPSSWHGTHVAGTIAAQHNDLGVRGIAPGISLMHVRVLAHCGGDDVDIVDGMRWAAGLTTDYRGDPWSKTGLSVNPHPADVINLSLGGGGNCSSRDFAKYRSTIAAVRAVGTVIVVSAGNDYGDVSNAVPASCDGVITVAATGPTGSRALYSNVGSAVDIAAPGGDETQGIFSTIAVGTTAQTDYGYTYYEGTSMAAPHITGAVALLRSIWPESTVDQVENELRLTVRAFPGSCAGCGAGLLDIGALLSRSIWPTFTISNSPELVVTVGYATTVSIEGAGGSVTLATRTPSTCSVSGMTVTGRRVGTCTLTATKARSNEHYITTSAALSVPVVAAPKSTRAPVAVISGNLLSVTVSNGSWSSVGTYSYAWFRCTSASRTSSCTAIPGAIEATYVLQRTSDADLNKFIRARVTLNANGAAVPAWSNATARIVAL